MIVVRDAIQIKASPERIMDFFRHFKESFHAWHPDHVECRYLSSPPLGEGSVIYIEEYLHGKLHKLKLRITKIEPYSRIEYKTFLGTRGVFILEPRGANTLFTAELHLGTRIPILSSLVDRFMREFFLSHLEGLKQHMSEEGQNLKSILESRNR